MSDEPIEVTLIVIRALEDLGVRYLIVGSLASTIYGEPRATRDADLLADIRHEHVQPLVQRLEADFNISKEAIDNPLLHRTSFNAIHYDSLFKVDVFVPKRRRFDEEELRRRVLHIVALNPDRYAYVATAEDVILAKLDWYKQGNEVSEQQ